MTWTLFGPRHRRVRASYLALVLAVMYAWPVMSDPPSKYPAYMLALSFVAAGWYTYLGYKERALISLAFLPAACLWLNPLFGATWFTHMGPAFFLSHSLMAVLFAIAGYTFAASEKA